MLLKPTEVVQRMLGFFEKKKPVAVKRPATPSGKARTTAKLAPVAPVEPLPKLFSSREDLPRYLRVLTARDTEFQISDRHHADLVAVLVDEKDVAIVVSPSMYRGAVYKQLIGRLQEKGYVISLVAKADPGLIQTMYATSGDDEKGVDTRIERAIDSVFQLAIAKNTSDIHIEKRGSQSNVKFRINGELVPHTEWSSKYAVTVARVLHAMADQDTKGQTFNENESQSLSISRELANGEKIKLRGQTVPAYPDGLDVVMRIHRVGITVTPKTLRDLGYAKSHEDMLLHMLDAPSGVIVFAGTTGSGKTTSLNTMMTMLIKENPGHKVITVEDPPEYVLPGATQIPVVRRRLKDGSQAENPFARTMRDTMRLDPDIIMVGEVRDPESGECLVAMVQSGHKVLTTIHASSAIDIAPRIASNGVALNVFASEGFVSGLIYQKLVPVLCPDCRVDYDPSMPLPKKGIHERIRKVARSGDTLFVRGNGCDKCNHTGIVDRTVCAEMIIPDDKMRKMFEQAGTTSAYEYWRSTKVPISDDPAQQSMVGMSALEHAVLKMRAGLVSPVDVETQLGHLTGSTYQETEDPVSSALEALKLA